ncbi:uncharacterized protein LOC101680073 isoform X3 [Mustela putorius furo]|uniref:Uncharacterized protein LOC101680073 isoform X3 n=1 Tax=Mustela putorius furo TaxID=9669 RepID=A0A8U0RT42_MUSPF|nr:uncharacterized protein LOC101680073 isoform X3 [Mustela putorius furo]
MAVVRTSSSWISKVVPSLLLPTWAVGSGASLSQPAEAGAGIAFGACGGLWTLGILLFVTLFLTNRGRAQRFLRGQLTHIVAWTWAFHVGLTVNLVWVWYRFQGLDRSQRTHWTDRLSWILLTFLPTVPLAVVITVSAVLLIKGRAMRRRERRGHWRRTWCWPALPWEEPPGSRETKTKHQEIREAGTAANPVPLEPSPGTRD